MPRRGRGQPHHSGATSVLRTLMRVWAKLRDLRFGLTLDEIAEVANCSGRQARRYIQAFNDARVYLEEHEGKYRLMFRREYIA